MSVEGAEHVRGRDLRGWEGDDIKLWSFGIDPCAGDEPTTVVTAPELPPGECPDDRAEDEEDRSNV